MSDSNSWETPQWLFDELNQEFNFEIDLCATRENSKCSCFYSDYLRNVFVNICYDRDEYASGPPIQTAFMNPPYSNPKPFIEKAWEDSRFCKIVCLVPNTIKTCKYMDILDTNGGQASFRVWKQGLEIRDLSRRTKFIHPFKQASSPSFGCMVLVMDRRNI